MPDAVLEWGIAVVLAMQGLGDWLIVPMSLFTFTGNIEFYLLIMPVLYWCYDSKLGLRIAIALTASIALNLILKSALHDPRPYWVDTRVRLLSNPESTFGIPSGHAQNSAVLWGMLAAHFKKGWFLMIAIVIIFLTGVSRIYLGVHFHTDVLAGWALGAFLLVLFLRLERPVINWLKQWNRWIQIAVVFTVSIISIGLGVWVNSAVSASWSLVTEWIQNAAVAAPHHPIEPLSIKDLVLSGGVFFGITAGAIWFDSQGGLDAGGPWGKRLGRYLVGVAGVVVLWQGLDILFTLLASEDGLYLGYILRYIRYGLIGIWVSALGPTVFIRLKLAEYNRHAITANVAAD